MSVPTNLKIYHIVHVDRLPSILADGFLWSDGAMLGRTGVGTGIGMSAIKKRRLNENSLMSHFGLMVGDCVPFYFCPRSVMLFLIHMRNPELEYKGGQEPIVHLMSDLRTTVSWAESQGKRWAFTLSNAGSFYFEDRADVSKLNAIDWRAVRAINWSGVGVSASLKEGKQAEFLVEERFPWELVEGVGVHSKWVAQRVHDALAQFQHRPPIKIKTDWYY